MNFNQEVKTIEETALTLLGLAETELQELKELLGNSPLKHDLTASILDLSRQTPTQKDPNSSERNNYSFYYDRLTGLPNQNYLIQQLQETIVAHNQRKEKSFAILVLDLDHFQQINGSLGYYLGDRLLAAVAQRLQQCVRPSDLLARLEGDKFVIILKNIDSIQMSEKIAYRIQNELSFPFCLMGEEICITASMGIALSCNEGNRLEKLLDNAGIAVCQAKALGRDGFVVLE